MVLQINVFELDEGRYGIPLADTREIFRAPSIAPLPKAPAIIEGMVNIRGTVTPVLNLRKRFGLRDKPPQPSDYLVFADAGPRPVALRVDRVTGIESVATADIEDASAITPHLPLFSGVARLEDGLVLIHDLRRFLDQAEAEDLDQALTQARDQAARDQVQHPSTMLPRRGER